MRVAVIGAGVTGLVAAHRLSAEGHRCRVYERWPGLGGQAATLDVGDGVLLERYYHHLFVTDRHITGLCAELDMRDEVEWHPSSVGIFTNGRSHPFTTPLDLVRFTPLSLLSRLRMGLAALILQRGRRGPEEFERITARDWIARWMGREAYDRVWGPLLRGKFGDRADELPMAWVTSKLRLRRPAEGRHGRGEVLGYPRRTFEGLFGALRDSIVSAGGEVSIDCPAACVAWDGKTFLVTPGAAGSFRRGHDPREFEPDAPPEPYEGVVATVPSDVFRALLDDRLAKELAPSYLERLESTEYLTAVCLLLELDRQFSPFYWTNVTDRELPFVGLIEQTNLVDPARYGGRRFLWVANYCSRGDPLSALDADDLLDLYGPGLRKINPGFTRGWVRQRWLFREPAAQPVVTLGYRSRIPALDTGLPGLVLANTTQIYPEDRGTNYGVRLGGDAASLMAAHLASVA